MRKCVRCQTADTPSAFCDDCIRRHSTVKLTAEQVEEVRRGLGREPSAAHVYLFHDGSVLTPQEMAAQTPSRTAQLVGIATKGFPMVVGRKFIQTVYPEG